MAAVVATAVRGAAETRSWAAVKAAEAGGAAALHVDLPSAGRDLGAALALAARVRRITELPVCCHVIEPLAAGGYARLVDAGAEAVVVQLETVPRMGDALRRIRAAGAKAGVAIGPATPLARLDPLLPFADVVLLVGDEAGTLAARALAVRERIGASRPGPRIEVEPLDAVGEGTPDLARSRADVVVAGASILAAGDPCRATRELALRLAGFSGA